MKILATGDIHSDLKLVEKIKKNVDFSDIELIVLIGDLSEKNNDFKKILSPFQNKPIIMTKGNHETRKKLNILKKFYNVEIIDNNPKIINNIGFFSPKHLTIGPNLKSETKTLYSIFNNFYKIYNKTKIHLFLTHIPPIGTKIGNSSIFFPEIGGNFASRIFLEYKKIDLTIVGHIHESSGLEEKIGKYENHILNTARTYKIIQIDEKEKKLSILN